VASSGGLFGLVGADIADTIIVCFLSFVFVCSYVLHCDRFVFLSSVCRQNWDAVSAKKWYIVGILFDLFTGLFLGSLPLVCFPFFPLLVFSVLLTNGSVLLQIDNFTNIFGLLTGFVLGLLIVGAHEGRRILVLVTLTILLVGVPGAFALLFVSRPSTEWCGFCKYIECVPIPAWDCR
jgi:hypothetical protein